MGDLVAEAEILSAWSIAIPEAKDSPAPGRASRGRVPFPEPHDKPPARPSDAIVARGRSSSPACHRGRSPTSGPRVTLGAGTQVGLQRSSKGAPR